MIKHLQQSFNDFKNSYKKYFSFMLFYMLLTSFLFVPLISFIFNQIVRMIGSGSLLNAEVYKIGYSATGLAGMMLITLLSFVLLFIELGVLILIAEQSYFRRTILVSSALLTTLRKLPSLFGFGFVQVIILGLFIMPFLDFSVYALLLDFNVPIYLNNWYDQTSYFSILLYGVFFALGIYLFSRCIFILHYIFIEEKTIWQSVKRSWLLTKNNRLKTLVYLGLFNLLLLSIWFIFATFIPYFPALADMILLGDVVTNYLVMLFSYVILLISLYLMPVNIIIITRLFYSFKENHGEMVRDQLIIHENNRLSRIEHSINYYFLKRQKLLKFMITVLLTGLFLINYSLNDVVYLKWDVKVAAHRGDSQNAPENSLSSIHSAITKGVDAIEIDVMLTKDDIVILFHDPTLKRIAGVPANVIDKTYEEISKLDIGIFFSDVFTGERIPTLTETLEFLKDENVHLILDLKPADRGDILVKKVVEIIEYYEMEQYVAIQAFNYDLLKQVRTLNPNIKLGQILYLAAGDLSKLDVDFYTIRQTMLSKRFIKNARQQNREVFVWTVNIDRNIREVLKYDIDGIITDYPEKVQKIIGIR